MAATTPRKKKPKQSLEQLLSAAQRPEKSVPICLRAELQAEYEDLGQQLQEAQTARRGMLTGGADGPGIAARMAEVREEMQDAVVQFRLRALPPKQFRKLLAAHPSPDPKKQFNDETFGPALLKATTVDVRAADGTVRALTDAEWESLIGDDGTLSTGQQDKLVDGSWILNKQDIAVPFSQLASTVTKGSAAR